VLTRQLEESISEGFEAVADEVPPSLTFNLELAGIGMSLISRKMMEVVYLTIDNLKFQYTNTAIAQAVNLSCGTLQIDNQLHDAIYPVILQPTPIARESSGIAALPTVQSSVIWLKDQGRYSLDV
jgi:vacuolar protein sorting-associated protein 13A/C